MKLRNFVAAGLALAALAVAGRVQAFDETHHGHDARLVRELAPRGTVVTTTRSMALRSRWSYR